MLYKLNKKVLGYNLDLYVSKSGSLYVSGPLGVTSNKLFFSFDLINNGISRSLSEPSIKHLFALINFSVSSVLLGYYIFIDLVGLGYKLKKLTPTVYRFYLGQSHFIYLYSPSDVLMWAFQSKIILFSIYPDKLFSISSTIMLLRKLNAYKLRGLMRPGQIITLKEGRQR